MRYNSTRDNKSIVSSAEAIVRGISGEGGLFVPQSFPALTQENLKSLAEKNYIDRAVEILSRYLTDFTAEELLECVAGAYSGNSFGAGPVAPIVKLGEHVYSLELWHGPTCAFKDMALQLLPRLMMAAAKKVSPGREIVILTATSGDTGKAALEGFRDVPGTRIAVFYPRDGVSHVQKLQMTTQEGGNVAVCGVEGNFDDAQTGVKKIFADKALAERLDEKGMMFSSANSINWGRLAPQIVYYVSVYCDLVKSGEISMGEGVNVCVPTGNFGNILAAYYAREMGLPLQKLICASNDNRVLTDFIGTGTYDRRRELVLTTSPSMDILISSNLERLLYSLSGGDDKLIAELMSGLTENGVHSVSDEIKRKMGAIFWGGSCSVRRTAKTIRETFREYSYLCDTHTAVAVEVLGQYVKETGDNTKTIIVSTANPYKFAGPILSALTCKETAGDEFVQIAELSRITGTVPPERILNLQDKSVRFSEICGREAMSAAVEKMLGL